MKKSASQRKATERQRKREQGLVPVEVWIRPEHKGKLKQFEREHGNEQTHDSRHEEKPKRLRKGTGNDV